MMASLTTGRWVLVILAMIKAGLPVGGGWPGAPRMEDVGTCGSKLLL